MNTELIVAVGMGVAAIGLGVREAWKAGKPTFEAWRNNKNALADPPELIELREERRAAMDKLGIPVKKGKSLNLR